VWTPEHFLLAAMASCYIETFKAVAKASKLDFQGIEVGVDGSLEKDAGGLTYFYVGTIRQLGFRLRKPRPALAPANPELQKAHKKTSRVNGR